MKTAAVSRPGTSELASPIRATPADDPSLVKEGLKAILKAARGDEHGECWTIRRWLDKHDVFNDDIEGPQRLIEEACKFLLRSSPLPASPERRQDGEKKTSDLGS